MKKMIVFILFLAAFALSAQTVDKSKLDLEYYEKFKGKDMSINVYNWGEYVSDGSDGSMDVNKEFEKLTGIKVNYTTYASNEEMYVKLKVGGVGYDVVIPSDYMIARLIKDGLIQKLDYSKIPAYTNIKPEFFKLLYDPFGEYSIAYTWGVSGIIYNTAMVNERPEEVDWNILFKDKYKGQILMYYNPRDAFGVALAYLGYSANTTNEAELREAAQALKKQKPLVQAYVMDEIYDKMESGEAAIGVYYAGDSLSMIENNKDLNFVIPPKGANEFVDAMCIPTSSKNVEAAYMYISFMCEAEIALANIEYIKYASPNSAAIAIMDEDMKNNPIIYPPKEVLDNAIVYLSLPDETNLLMDELWNEVLTTDNVYKGWVIPIALLFMIIICIIIITLSKKRKREMNNINK